MDHTSIHIEAIEGMPSTAVLSQLTELNQSLFGLGETAEHLAHLLGDVRRSLLLLATVEGRAVGFKLGFQCDHGVFESWRGGVDPAFRRQGLAHRLMERQHAWCADAGFRSVRTAVSTDNVGMIILNLRCGLRITDTYVNQAGKLRLSLEKRL